MLTFIRCQLGDLVSYILLGICYTLVLTHFILLLTPNFGFNYCVKGMSGRNVCFYWDYNEVLATTEIINEVEPWVLLTLEACTFSCYVVVLVSLALLRAGVGGNRHKEVKILMVSLVSFGYEVALIGFMYWGSDWLPLRIETLMAINVLWMLDSGVFPIATIAINT
ncbi:hypothetical protein L596_019218 [Steinernema carpocapsae]|uniref:Uncharacterized protein n=1 Tax=Steinernema carpocapsae TaxID=34508 RepID=A0A4U5MQQ8_STECR|nr:hypothetical protein L596_019218 [Steinernema carpocapsae]